MGHSSLVVRARTRDALCDPPAAFGRGGAERDVCFLGAASDGAFAGCDLDDRSFFGSTAAFGRAFCVAVLSDGAAAPFREVSSRNAS
jgi:hypothetical protein